MTDVLEPASIEKPDAESPVSVGAREAYYTICPVFSAANAAQELGWIEEEFRKIDAKLSYLRALPPEKGYLPHFSHRFEHLFRDGGNIPSIWAKADVSDTTLIGLTGAHHGGLILVRANDDVHSVADLRGRRFGLSKSQNPDKVDWWRATSERGILIALRLAGLGADDVAIIDIANPDRGFGGAVSPSDLWRKRNRSDLIFNVEIRALEAGEVDAVYTSHGRGQALERTGRFKAIEDFSRYPDWTLQVSNSPYALTVSTDFAKENRDIVVAFLRATVRAARWLDANPIAGAAILHRVTYHQTPEDVARAIAQTAFLPTLSAQKLAGLDIQKRFLLERGYIANDFDVHDWADGSYLEEALATA